MRIIKTNLEDKEVEKRIYGEKAPWLEDLSGNSYAGVRAISLNKSEHEKIVSAQHDIVALLHKVQELLRKDLSLNEWTGIPEKLYKLANTKEIETLTTFGRFDWLIDLEGTPKLLEFNAETPMGWIESLEFQRRATESCFHAATNPNEDMKRMFVESVEKTLKGYGLKGYGTIAIVGDLDDHEENDNFSLLADILRESGHEVMLCSVKELRFMKDYEDLNDGVYVEREGLLFYVDVMMNFYSAEWMAQDEAGNDLVEFINKGIVKLMNPISTLQLHSKGIFALIWFILNETDLLDSYEDVIHTYIPYSTFEPRDFFSQNDLCVKKPLNHREGDGIEIVNIKDVETEDYIVYQEFIDGQKMFYMREDKDGKALPFDANITIGTFCLNDKFGGYFTRVSQGICSVYDTTFIPTIIEW